MFLVQEHLLTGSGERALSYTQMGAVVGDRGLVLKQHSSSHKNDIRLLLSLSDFMLLSVHGQKNVVTLSLLTDQGI